MADVTERSVGPAQRVVYLGQAPRIVVAGDGVVAVADPDLVVQRPGFVVPHLEQPVNAEPGLGGEVRLRPVPEQCRAVADARQHHVHDIARGLDELHVVAGVGPAARHVDRSADPGEVVHEDAVRVVLGPRVDEGGLVVQVGRLAVQHGCDDLRPVTLGLVEGECVR